MNEIWVLNGNQAFRFDWRANRVLDRNQLMDLTLGREATPLDRSIDVQVSRLRQRLRDDAREPRIIKTVRNGGYVLAATVEQLDA